jgi:hypothetical protein
MSFGGSGGKKQPVWAQFVISGLSGMGAAVCTHPFDTIKVRMQIAGIGQAHKAGQDGIVTTGF